jgi:hypothetical protein
VAEKEGQDDQGSGDNNGGGGGSGNQGNEQGGRWDNWSQKGAEPKGKETR